jgi:coproporphyrinogen III oxidase-like Fe-S oxidoreductase
VAILTSVCKVNYEIPVQVNKQKRLWKKTTKEEEGKSRDKYEHIFFCHSVSYFILITQECFNGETTHGVLLK